MQFGRISNEKQLKNDRNYHTQIMTIMPNSFVVNFENLKSNPIETISEILYKFKMNLSKANIEEIINSTFNKRLSKWNTHLNESKENIREEVGISIKNILSNNSKNDPKEDLCSKVLLLYKKIIYNAEFSIKRQEIIIEDRNFKLESSLSKEFFKIKLNTKHQLLKKFDGEYIMVENKSR